MAVFACHRHQAQLAGHGSEEQIFGMEDFDPVDIEQLGAKNVLD